MTRILLSLAALVIHDTDKTAGVYYPSQNQRDLTTIVHEIGGAKAGLRLQPAFALWMMGFPEDWCDLKDGE